MMKPEGTQLTKITKLLEEGILKPVIDREYSLDQIQEAMTYSESGRAKGKIIINVK